MACRIEIARRPIPPVPYSLSRESPYAGAIHNEEFGFRSRRIIDTTLVRPIAGRKDQARTARSEWKSGPYRARA